MKVRIGLVLTVAALVAATARVFAEAPPVFQPEVLLMKTAAKGTEKSFSYAKLKPATAEGKDNTAAFRYRADIDTVSVTIHASRPDAAGVVTASILTQRTRTLADGHEETTNKTGTYKFTPGKSLIIDDQPRLMANQIDGNVEVLQITLVK